MASFQELTPSGEKTHSMNPLATPAIEPGTVLVGKFRVKGLLGVGGMGSVHSVDHLLMEKEFALKCMNKFQEVNASWRRHLYELGATVCGLGDHSLANLTKSKSLKLLALSTNSISDKGIATLLPLKTLEWLDVSRTLVTPELASIVKKFPRLRKLEMGLHDWTPSVKEKFVKEVKKVNPKVEIYFDEIATHDPANLPGFHWMGGGLIGHANTARMLPPSPTDSVTERRPSPVQNPVSAP